jgi:hypothetical protein
MQYEGAEIAPRCEMPQCKGETTPLILEYLSLRPCRRAAYIRRKSLKKKRSETTPLSTPLYGCLMEWFQVPLRPWRPVALALCWTARLGMPPKFSRPQVEAVLVARIEAESRLQESTSSWQDATERAKHRKAMEWATLANNDVSLVNAAKHQWGRLFGTVEFKSEEAEMPESRKQRRLRSVRDWMAEEGPTKKAPKSSMLLPAAEPVPAAPVAAVSSPPQGCLSSPAVISATTTALVAVDGDELRDGEPHPDALAASALLQFRTQEAPRAVPPPAEPPAPPASHQADRCPVCLEGISTWQCVRCRRFVHRACIVTHAEAVRRKECTCPLDYCTCKQVPSCPVCREPLPREVGGVRCCGTPGCVLPDHHDGACSPEAASRTRTRSGVVALTGGSADEGGDHDGLA